MMKQLIVVLCVFVSSLLSAQTADHSSKFALSDGWHLQSSAKVEKTGDRISSPGFATEGWYTVSVPTTVVAALVKQKVYPDPTFGMNLRQLPGVTYPIGANFSNVAMQADSPFAVPWWYRKQFTLPADYKGKTLWLEFRGINYKANIWLNGKQIAKSDEVAGAWRTYEFNVTDAAKPGAVNVLAVETFAPTETDLAITFVDWNPAPPDKNMGLWREVYLTTSGPVAVRYPTVITKLNSPVNDKANLLVTALLKNGSNQAVKGTLKGRIENVEFSEDVELAANESKDVVFDPAKFSQLNFDKPRLWWPVQMGTPNLYDLTMTFEIGGKVSDVKQAKFGIREMTSELDQNKNRVFSVNGKKILIRGGGYTPDFMLREDLQNIDDQFRYVLDMGLNTVRLEGKLETEEFFEMADRYGVLIMAGWCCCDHWEHWPKWKPQDFDVAKASLTDQIYRLRSHPSLIMWLNGSDNPPPPDVEEMYLAIEKQLMWPNPVVSSATGKLATVTGDSGVKMTGPYEYIAPQYWMEDDGSNPAYKCNPGGCGGSHGFNTETSMGPAVPPIESLEKMLPKDHLWPIDEYWNFHAGGGAFKDIHVFTDALNARYGTAQSAQDYAMKSQMMTYEGVRAMYEAYGRDKYRATGVIQWMLNNAWPSVIWHLYDYYMRPGGGYFGAKIAMEPLHPVYGYNDRSISVVSSQYQDAKGLKLSAKVYDVNMKEKFSKDTALDVAADTSVKAFAIPEITDTPVYFVALRLADASGKQVGSNFYWLSSKQETIDWEKTNWYTVPTASYADYTALAKMPKVKLKATSRTERKGKDAVTHVTVENPSKDLAFFVRLKVSKGNEEILPVLWQDNYISLLPGEKREISATYRATELGTAKPSVEVKGWNAD